MIKTDIGCFLSKWEGEYLTELRFIKEYGEEQLSTENDEKLKKQLEEYLKGERKKFDIPLKLQGTKFQMKVWKELLKIQWGEVKTYGEIAKDVDLPKAARAVGLACNKNPIIILVPCHRVVGKGGKLTGYAPGLDVKEKLLAVEKSPFSIQGFSVDKIQR